MLIKGNDVIGLTIMSIQQGKKIETVSDLIYDPKNHTVRALLVDDGGWFSEAKTIPFADIKSIGKDAVMVESDSVIKKASEISERVASIATDDTYLTKTKIVTETGTELGKVSDIYFDDATGAVVELEVSQGLANLQSGKKRVKVADIITIGEDATIVKNFTEDTFDAQGENQGLQGLINKGKDTFADVTSSEKKDELKQTLSDAKDGIHDKITDIKNSEKTQAVISTVKEKTNQATTAVNSKMTDAKDSIQDKRTEAALGKYLTINVVTPSDELIAKRGELVTNEVIIKAERYNIVEKVLMNTSQSPPTVAYK